MDVLRTVLPMLGDNIQSLLPGMDGSVRVGGKLTKDSSNWNKSTI